MQLTKNERLELINLCEEINHYFNNDLKDEMVFTFYKMWPCGFEIKIDYIGSFETIYYQWNYNLKNNADFNQCKKHLQRILKGLNNE